MFNSPRLARSTIDPLASKRLLNEKCQTIEQLKQFIDELKGQHEKREEGFIRQIGLLYHDLQQNRKKTAHLILKYQQQQKKFNENIKTSRDCSTQTDETTSTVTPERPKYYTLGRNEHLDYISATPSKHHESSSSAYNTAESLPSSQYSDGTQTLERVLHAASTMYTTQANLEHTIKLQEDLFRQRLRLRGIQLHDDDQSSEHFYDNIDSETSDIEQPSCATTSRHRSLPWTKKPKVPSSKETKVRFSDQYYSLGKRKHAIKSSASKQNLLLKSNSFHSTNKKKTKKSLSSKLLTVTIT